MGILTIMFADTCTSLHPCAIKSVCSQWQHGGKSLELLRLYYTNHAALWLFSCAFPTWPKVFSIKEKLIPFCMCSFWQISAVRWNCLISSRGQEKCLPRSCRPCRGSYRVNSVTPSEKWDTLPAQLLYSFPLFHVQLSPFRFMSMCMRQWTSTAALRSGPTPQPRSDIF